MVFITLDDEVGNLLPDQVGREVRIPSLPFYVIFTTSTDEIRADLAHCFGALIFLAMGEQRD